MSESSASVGGDGESGNELWAPPFPGDILPRIVARLTCADHAALRATCKSWRTIFSAIPPPPIPACSPSSSSPAFRPPRSSLPQPSLRNPTFRPLPSLSDTTRHVCVGCSHGWLILLGPTSHISLLNPLTAATIPLPPPLSSVPLSFPLYDERTVDRYLLFRGDTPRRLRHLAALVRLAVLSADPTDDPSSFILVLVLGNTISARIITCGPSDGYAAWRHHTYRGFPAYGVTDLIFHHGLCFAAVMWRTIGDVVLGPGDSIAVFDFHATPAFQRFRRVSIPENDVEKNYANFFIESAGDLLLISRHRELTAGRILVHRLPPFEGDGPLVPTPWPALAIVPCSWARGIPSQSTRLTSRCPSEETASTSPTYIAGW
uniref:Uncharacterized protein n=1 Tax=Ananas comosus var. bracteatus TaxID=296719 RepID=A0A6V7PDJ4_ANACO|nr:unnamed protein product [Ananas comosus var. bracteatus]